MENRFKAESSSYKLDVLFMEDKLKITLTDFVDGINYYRQYGEQDIGKQINRKVDLKDLYQSLIQSEKPNEGNQKQEGAQDYELGDIVETDGAKCYKVDRSGKLTIYVIYKKPNQEIVLQSELHLVVKSNISDLEMEKHRININKKQYSRYLIKEVEDLKKDNQKMRGQLKQLQNKMMDKFNEIKQILVGKQGGIIKTGDEQQQMMKGQKNNKQMQMGYLTAISQANVSKFQISGNLIQYIDQNGWTQLIFNQYIPYSQTFVFKVKIIRSQAMHIMIGVVDYMKQKDQRNSHPSKNSICYYTQAKGYIYCSQEAKTLQNSPLTNNNQIIQVEVNRASQKIAWKMNGKQLGQITDSILSDKLRIFLPYIEMYNQKDIVQYIQI